MRQVLLILGLMFLVANAIEFIHTESYKETIERIKNDRHHLSSLILITTATECDKCKQALKVYEEFMYEVDNVVKSYVLDCRKILDNQVELPNIPTCYEANADLLPALVFYQPNEDKNQQPIEKQFTGPLSLSALLEAADRHAPYYSTFLEDIEELDQIFLRDTSLPTKVILLRPDDRIPMYWKGLTSFYRNRIDFAEMDSDEKILHKRYSTQPNKLDILILTYDSITKTYSHKIYPGGKRYEVIRSFLKPYAAKRKVEAPHKIKKPRTFYDQDPSTWEKVDQVRFPMMKSILKTDGQWVMIHFPVDGKFHPKFKTFKNQFKGLIKFYEVNCDSQECQDFLTNEYKVKTFPGLLIYSFNKKLINIPTLVMHKDSIGLISEILFDSLQSQTSSFRVVDEQLVLTECKQILDSGYNPVLWFYDDEDPYWKLVAATISSIQKYSKFLKFVFSKNPSVEVKNQFGIQKFPMFQTFIDMNLDSGEHRKYDFGGQNKLDQIFQYFNQVLDDRNQNIQTNKDIEATNTQDLLETKCQNNDRLCVVAFLDTVKEGRFNQDQETLRNVFDLINTQKDKRLSWIWIDGRCQGKLLEKFKFDTDKFPHLIVYDPSNGKYQKLEAYFNEKEITKFLLLATDKQNKKLFQNLPHVFELENRNCEKIKLQLKEEYLQEKEKRHKLFIQAEREKDKEREQLKRIQEQKELLEDFDDDKKIADEDDDHQDYDDDL